MDENALRWTRLQDAGRLWTTGQKDEGRASYLATWREASELW